MNDLDQLREMRADISTPTRADLAPGRAALLASMSRPARRNYLRRAILPIGFAAAAATVTAVLVIAGGTGSPVTIPSTKPINTTSMNLTAQVLNNASVTVARRPATRPGPHQWFYTKFVEYQYGHGTASDENWISFDGRQTAYRQNGKVVVHTGPVVGGGTTPLDRYDADPSPLTAYNALASLPTDPNALVDVVHQHVAALGADASEGGIVSLYAPTSDAEREFDYVSQLLWNAFAGAPPTAVAAVFRAMATISGVSVQQGITNVAGQAAVGLSANGGKTQLLLDPKTYQVNGMRTVSTGTPPDPKISKWPAKGGVADSMAWATISAVSGPGKS